MISLSPPSTPISSAAVGGNGLPGSCGVPEIDHLARGAPCYRWSCYPSWFAQRKDHRKGRLQLRRRLRRRLAAHARSGESQPNILSPQENHRKGLRKPNEACLIGVPSASAWPWPVDCRCLMLRLVSLLHGDGRVGRHPPGASYTHFFWYAAKKFHLTHESGGNQHTSEKFEIAPSVLYVLIANLRDTPSCRHHLQDLLPLHLQCYVERAPPNCRLSTDVAFAHADSRSVVAAARVRFWGCSSAHRVRGMGGPQASRKLEHHAADSMRREEVPSPHGHLPASC